MEYYNKNAPFKRERRAKRRTDYLSDKSCAYCEQTINLEFHHIDSSAKLFNINWTWSWERISKEIDKCIILCIKCHNKETAKERAKKLKHGTRSMYGKGCKCDPCMDSERDYARARRAK